MLVQVLGILALLTFLMIPWLVRVEGRRPGFVAITMVVLGTTLPIVGGRAGLIDQTSGSLFSAACYAIALTWSYLVPALTERMQLGVREVVLLGLGVVPLVVGLFLGDPELSGAQGVGTSIGQLVCPLVTVSLLARDVRRDHLLKMVRRVSGVVLLTSVLLFLLMPSAAYAPVLTTGGQGDARLAGLFSHPNSLGPVAVAYLVALIATCPSPSRVVALSLLPAVVIVQTDMRTALISVVLVLVTFMMRGVGNRVLVLSSLLLLMPVLWLSVTGVIEQLVARRSASVDSRMALWRYLGQNWGEYVPWGLGPNGVFRLSVPLNLPEDYFHAHNQLLTLLVTGGVVTLGLFGLCVFWLCRESLRDQRVMLVLAGGAPLAIFESPLHTGLSLLLQGSAILWWVLLGAALASGQDRSDEKGERAHGRRPSAVAQ